MNIYVLAFVSNVILSLARRVAFMFLFGFIFTNVVLMFDSRDLFPIRFWIVILLYDSDTT